MSYEVPTEYFSPLVGVPSRTSRPGIDQSRPAVVASGTLNGGSGVRLFEQPVNIVNRSDVSSVIKVDFVALGVSICGVAIGSNGFNMCVKRVGQQCTIQKQRNTLAIFVKKKCK
mmetsp:Transcript_20881/g.22336  ORF Transcript_20881/g.22336 Transcript_20881/m.22336 type:complete len:114 (+) Transcript_20881:77-418(+)